MDTNTHCLLYLAQFFSEQEKFQTQAVEKIKKKTQFSPPKSRAVYEIMLKNMVESDMPKMTI
jgi:hypothetical protein